MIISGFSVTEFGALRGVKGTLGPRLSVIWGWNGSGKTTLSHFFRHLLFADGNEGEQRGQGFLQVRMSDGRNLRIELSGGEKLFGDTKDFVSATAAAPEDLLPFRAKDYESEKVFLAADADFEAFAKFMGFTKKLDALERRLYVPDDPESSLNKLWAGIKNNELQIESLQGLDASREELRKALEEKRGALEAARRALEQSKSALAGAELTAKARPAWLLARDLEAELAALAQAHQTYQIREMPRRGLERMKPMQDKIAALRSRLNERRRKNAYESSRRRQMENNPIMTLLEYGEALEDLERLTGGGTMTREEKAALSAEAAAAGEFLKKELADIAPHWGEDDLLTADLSIAAERQARAMSDALRDLRGRSEQLLGEKTAEENKIAALRAEITARLPAEGPGIFPLPENSHAADYRAKREALSDVRRGLLRYDALRWEIRGEKACAEIIENEIKSDASPPPRAGNYAAKLFLAVLAALAGLSVAAGIYAPAFRPYDLYSAALCALAALGPVFSFVMSGKEHLARVAQWKAVYNRRNGDLDWLDEKISEQRREMQTISASIEPKAKRLGLKDAPTLQDLDETVRLLENERRDAEALEAGQTALKQLADELAKRGVRLGELGNKLSGLNRELDAARENWKNWLLQNRFAPNLPPESFGTFMTAARAARSNLQNLRALRRKLAAQLEHDASIDALISELNAKTGLNLDREGLPKVFSSLREARSLRARVDASLEDKQALDFECSEIETELASAVGGLRALFEEAGAESEEEFRTAFESQALRSSLEARLAGTKRVLTGILGENAVISEPALLADGAALAGKTEALRLAAADCERLVETLRGEAGSLEARLDDMTRDGRIASLRRENETLKASAEKEFRRWLAAVLLKHCAGRALERRGKNPEPETLTRARQFLSLISASDWKIVPDTAADGGGKRRFGNVALEREADSLRLGETQWSSGLSEQVALSLKLAAVCRMAERAEPVPLMLDDALARFDERAQRGAVEALWRASEKTQVIFFTCHRSVADMFRSRLEAEKGFVMVEMSENAPAKERAKRKTKSSRR